MPRIKCPDCNYGKLYVNECGVITNEPTPTIVASYPCPTCKGAGTIEVEDANI